MIEDAEIVFIVILDPLYNLHCVDSGSYSVQEEAVAVFEICAPHDVASFTPDALGAGGHRSSKLKDIQETYY